MDYFTKWLSILTQVYFVQMERPSLFILETEDMIMYCLISTIAHLRGGD
jgi:hypothetical protein